MIRISALNDSESSDEEEKLPVPKGATKEAQEAEAFSIYNKALGLLNKGEAAEAAKTFTELLNQPFIKEAAPLTSEDGGLVQPGLILKYSSYKNLGSLAAQEKNNEKAMENYLEAVMVDSSDVTVWYKIGTIAMKLDKYQLARHAFESGLDCNPRHWPCLDKVITILYTLNNYEVCLLYIARALERDPGYVKGLAFLDQVFSEHPSLKRDTRDMFCKCDPVIHEMTIDPEEQSEFVNEALEMRRIKRELEKPLPMAVLNFVQPLTHFTWKSLGEGLVTLYDDINKKLDQPQDLSKTNLSLACKVDLSTYVSMDPATMATSAVTLTADSAPVLPSEATATISAGDMVPMETESAAVPSAAPQEGNTGEVTERSEVNQGSGEEVIAQEPVASQPSTQENNQTVAMEMDELQKVLGRKGAKRKRLPFNEDLLERRKSARVRNTSRKKEQEVINYQELLRKFLPSSLLEVQTMDDEDSQNYCTPVPAGPAPGEGESAGSPLPSLGETEEREAVHTFLRTHQNNCGVIDLLNEYLISLAHLDHLLWPKGVSDTYIAAYNKVRQHIIFPGYLCKDTSDSRIRDMAHIALLQAELKVDKWNTNKANLSRNISPKRLDIEGIRPKFVGSYFNEDLIYCLGITPCADILGEELWPLFRVRVFWMKAKLMTLQGSMEDAIDCFDKTSDCLRFAEVKSGESITVRATNCVADHTITLKTVIGQLDSLKRCQSLEEIQRLHDNGNYERVVELLLQTFTEKKVLEGLQERHAQLLLLQDSLIKMKDFKRCMYWGEMSVNEALKKFLSALSSTAKDQWLETMTKLLAGLSRVLSEELEVVQTLPSKSVVRLTANLVRIIDFAMDVPEGASDMAITTLLPWILLYKLIKHEEQRLLPLGEQQVVQECLPSSLMLLNVGHDYLGRRNWCVAGDGELLLFTVEELSKKLKYLEPDHPWYQELALSVEQCFYCMYGHPNKRTKAKRLIDHNINQVNLTWERCEVMFEYFKPKTMPEYDSYKTSTVSGELENLLRRISSLVPDMENPVNTFDTVSAYIDGAIDTEPSIPEGKDFDVPVVGELYYLLADYYFKNKEQAKAIKFYINDICYNPYRFDAWAGMALARASRLEQKLNSHELKPEAPIQKQAISALRCFKRALALDDTNGKIWIEYGSLAYQLHSHASRQLKQAKACGLSDELRELARTNKAEMLRIASQCYNKAAECEAEEENGEEWLHHYMLGKIAEKLQKHPEVYLKHYKMALNHLYEDEAKYPKKITYYYSAPHLAVESLELFYRLHVCVLKYLMRHVTFSDWPPGGADSEIPYDLFDEYLSEAAVGPFATATEKPKPERKLSDRPEAGMDESSSSNLQPPFSAPAPATSGPRRKKKDARQLPDHTYSKQKVTSESSEQSSQESADCLSPDVGAGLFRGSPRAAPFSTTPPRPPGISPVGKAILAPPTGRDVFSMEAILGSVIEKHLVAPESSTTSSSPCSSSTSISAIAKTGESTTTVNKSPNENIKSPEPSSSCTSSSTTVNSENVVVTNPPVEDNVVGLSSARGPSSPAQLLATSQSGDSASPMPSGSQGAYAMEQRGERVDTVVAMETDVFMDTDLKDVKITSIPSSQEGSVIETPAVTLDSVLSSLSGPTSSQSLPDDQEARDRPHTSRDNDKDEAMEVEDVMGERMESFVTTTDSLADFDVPDIDTPDFIPTTATRTIPLVTVEPASPFPQQRDVITPDALVPGLDESGFSQPSLDLDDIPTPDIGLELSSPHLSQSALPASSTPAAHLDQSTLSLVSEAQTTDTRSSSLPPLPRQETGPFSVSESAADVTYGSEDDDDVDIVLLVDGTGDDKEDDLAKGDPSRSHPASNQAPPATNVPQAPLTQISVSTAQTIPSTTNFHTSTTHSGSRTTVELDFTATSSSSGSDSDSIDYAVYVLDEESGKLVEKIPEASFNTGQSATRKSNEPVKAEEDERSSGENVGAERPAEVKREDERSGELMETEDGDTSGKTGDARDQLSQSMDKDSGDVIILDDSYAKSATELPEKSSFATVPAAEVPKMDVQPDVIKVEKSGGNVDEAVKMDDDYKRVDIKPAIPEQNITLSCDSSEKNITGQPGIESMAIGMDKKLSDNKIDENEEVFNAMEQEKEEDNAKKYDDNTTEKIADITVENKGSVNVAEKSDEKSDGAKKDEEKRSENTQEGSTKSKLTDKQRYLRVMRLCIRAFELCLSRFPQHYKSLYRLAYIYFYSPDHQEVQKCYDLLLGGPQWQTLDHMPCPGLFTERKNTNFFQGLWKIPIEEIDRAGSFATHLRRAILLLFETLKKTKDPKMLFQMYNWLSRTPDQGKKYLRDYDRTYLAKLSYEYSVEAAAAKAESIAALEGDDLNNELLQVHRIWQHGIKTQTQVDKVNTMFSELYNTVRKGKVDPEPSVLEQAIRFCQLLLAQKSPQILPGDKVGLVSPSVGKSVSLTPTNLFPSPSQSGFESGTQGKGGQESSSSAYPGSSQSSSLVSSPVKSSSTLPRPPVFPRKIPEPTRVAKPGPKPKSPGPGHARPKSLSLAGRPPKVKSTGLTKLNVGKSGAAKLTSPTGTSQRSAPTTPGSSGQRSAPSTPSSAQRPGAGSSTPTSGQKGSGSKSTPGKHAVSPRGQGATPLGYGSALPQLSAAQQLTAAQLSGSAPISPELLAELITQQQIAEIAAQQHLAEAMMMSGRPLGLGASPLGASPLGASSLGASPLGASSLSAMAAGINPYSLWSSMAASSLYGGAGLGATIDLTQSPTTTKSSHDRSPATGSQARKSTAGTSHGTSQSRAGSSAGRHGGDSAQSRAVSHSSTAAGKTTQSSGRPGQSSQSSARPGQSSQSSARPGQSSQSSARPGQGSQATARLGQISQSSARPGLSYPQSRPAPTTQAPGIVHGAPPRSGQSLAALQRSPASSAYRDESDSDCVIISSSMESDDD